MDYISPPGQKWFKWGQVNADSDTKDWFAKATEAALYEMATSRFYEVLGISYQDRVLGTSCFLIEHDGKKLMCTFIPFGTYAIAQNEHNDVDTLVRKFKFTAHQAASAFGEEELPPTVREALMDESKRFTQDFEFWHLTCPRRDYDIGVQDVLPERMQWASVYLFPQDKSIVQEGGYYEFPYAVSRFLRKSGEVYGTSPAWDVIDEMEDYPVYQQILRTMGQRQAFPSVLTLAKQVGEVDMRAGGQTIISEEAARLGMPKEWGTSGRFDIGLQLMQDMNDAIDEAYFIPMLNVISSRERQMTATEVNAIESERIMAFSPSFIQNSSDLAPAMHRIFALLFRAGKLPQEGMPEGIFEYVVDKDKRERIALVSPQVTYLGRMAQAIERSQKQSLEGLLQTFLSISPALPQELNPVDCLDVDQIVRWYYDASGAPAEGLRPVKKVEQLRANRAAQAQQLQAAQVQQMQANANMNNANAAQTQQTTKA